MIQSWIRGQEPPSCSMPAEIVGREEENPLSGTDFTAVIALLRNSGEVVFL